MIETLIVLWFVKTLIEIIGEAAVKETALLKGKEVEFRSGKKYHGRSRSALWGTLASAAGEVWTTRWDARKQLRTEVAQGRADRKLDRVRQRTERRAARRTGPELDVPEWLTDPPSRPDQTDDDRPSAGPDRTGIPDQTAAPDRPASDRGPGRSGPDRPSGPERTGPDRTGGATPVRQRADGPGPDPTAPSGPPPDEPIPSGPRLELVRPLPENNEGAEMTGITESGEGKKLDQTDSLLQQIATYIETEMLNRLEAGSSALASVKLTDGAVITPYEALRESLRTALAQANACRLALNPHRGVQDVISATQGVARDTGFYERV